VLRPHPELLLSDDWPPGTGWIGGSPADLAGNSCYGNGNGVNVPRISFTNLGLLTLTGTASYATSANALIKLAISGGSSYSVNTDPANILNLYQNWHQSEFNVVGDASGSQAVFNGGTSITVSNALANVDGGPIASTCASGAGTTGETNNLFLQPCTGSSSGISFVECISTQGTSTCPSRATSVPEFPASALGQLLIVAVGLLCALTIRQRRFSKADPSLRSIA